MCGKGASGGLEAVGSRSELVVRSAGDVKSLSRSRVPGVHVPGTSECILNGRCVFPNSDSF